MTQCKPFMKVEVVQSAWGNALGQLAEIDRHWSRQCSPAQLRNPVKLRLFLLWILCFCVSIAEG